MTGHSSRASAIVAVAIAAIAASAWAASPITAVPPAELRAGSEAKAASARLLLAPGAPAHRITLSEPSSSERATLGARNAAGTGARNRPKGPLALAFPRNVPTGAQSIAFDALGWQALPDGSRAARIEVLSPGAAALRVALRMPAIDAGVSLRFSGNGERAQVFGPIPANTVASDTARFGRFWSPILAGDLATIEIHAGANVPIPRGVLVVDGVSHQVVAAASLGRMGAKDAQDIGSAGRCEIDVACVTPQSPAFADSRRAVAAMEFTRDDGFTYLCTGQLLNDSVASNTPYFFTANHCLDSAGAARTLNTFWFFDAIACGDRAVPPYVQQAAGAAMLARSVDWDWALVRLDAAPPPGSRFSAWRAEPLPAFVTATVLHHPEGDLKKWAQGRTLGYLIHDNGAAFAQVQYDQGTTEPGSSGAGLLTYLDAGGYYELRGGLWQGAASCENPTGIDEYSRLDNMLPLTRQFLTPDQPGTAGQAVAVEFYNAALDHYFITINPGEISDLDNHVHPGWERTGMRFLAYESATPGTNPVCRFYRTPGFGDSHFYSAIPSECQTVIDNPQTYPGWTEESANVFYIALPDASGACPSGTTPIWRFFNQRTTNHRYTTDRATRDAMRADPLTWLPEGFPPDDVAMCAPLGG